MAHVRDQLPMFPLAPLLELVERRLTHAGLRPTAKNTDVIEQLCGISSRTYTRWRMGHTAQVPGHVVDRACVRMGLHPGLVYPEWWTLRIEFDELPREEVA